MTDLAPTATILASFHEVVAGAFRRLRTALPVEVQPDGPSLEVFEGMAGGAAGLSASVTARRPDTRALFWQVELWIDRDSLDERWWATVKDEIDLDDGDGEPWCVLNEQRSVTNAAEAAAAIRALAETVSGYPIPELLAMTNPPRPELED